MQVTITELSFYALAAHIGILIVLGILVKEIIEIKRENRMKLNYITTHVSQIMEDQYRSMKLHGDTIELHKSQTVMAKSQQELLTEMVKHLKGLHA